MKYNRQAFCDATDEAKTNLIKCEIDLETHNGTTKDDLLMMIEWLYDKATNQNSQKAPEFEGDGYDNNGNLIYDTWICPSCGKRYEVDYDDYKFCPECGQKIDWNS